MTPADLATLSLIDPEQGVCPSGHPCQLNTQVIGRRRCANGEYVGMPLICWDITQSALDNAALVGADPIVLAWAREFIAARDAEA